MKHFLIDQKRLHRKALELIYEIECVRDLFKGFDQEYKEQRIAEKIEEYQKLMNELKEPLTTAQLNNQ